MSLPFVIRDVPLTRAQEREVSVPRMDEESFRAFYERTARRLWAYLSRITGDPSQADDLLQEAYYRFYRMGDRHESETHRRNSLFQIATNLVRDSQRRASHHEDVPIDDGEDSGAVPVSFEPIPERQAEIRTDLARAMAELEPVQRQMLWLAYVQGASHVEIAEILGLRSVSIKTTLLRARRKLAGILNGEASR